MKGNVVYPHMETIGDRTYKVSRVTGEIARILTGRNSYLFYRLVENPVKLEQREKTS